MVALTARNLRIGYGPRAGTRSLFDALDLDILCGELVCLMGPNGVGKSTLLKTLAGLHPPLAGSLAAASPDRVAVVLTEKIQSPHLTVRELVAFGRYPYLDWRLALRGHDKKIIDASLAAVRVEALADKSLAELSDGQLQMVMIARALAQQTPLLLLDEPTAHLDLNNRVEIMNLLRRLAHSQNKAIVVATHELDLALQTADRVWLAAGHTVVQGLPEDLVLNGAFDSVFRLKGFDLKTGKVQHQPHRRQKLRVRGGGYRLLWTKNALERAGFEVDENEGPELVIQPAGWQLEGLDFCSLQEVLAHLTSQINT